MDAGACESISSPALPRFPSRRGLIFPDCPDEFSTKERKPWRALPARGARKGILLVTQDAIIETRVGGLPRREIARAKRKGIAF